MIKCKAKRQFDFFIQPTQVGIWVPARRDPSIIVPSERPQHPLPPQHWMQSWGYRMKFGIPVSVLKNTDTGFRYMYF